MSGVNKVILIGNLVKDPEVRYLDKGITRCTFALATTEIIVRDGKRTEQTEYHNIVLWRALADIAAKHLSKGKQIYVEGKLRTRHFEDRNGAKRTITEIYGENITMLGKRDDETKQPYPPTQDNDNLSIPKMEEPRADFGTRGPEDELPF